MNEEEKKEISIETPNEIKQNKKRRKKRHKRSNDNEQILQEEKKEESKLKINEKAVNIEEIKIESKEETKDKEKIENKEEPKNEINLQIEKKEINIPNAIQSTIIKEEIISPKDASFTKNEEKNHDNKDTKPNQSKGTKKNKKRKNKKEERNEEKNIKEKGDLKYDIDNNNILDDNNDKGIYPIKDIDPINLISVDEDDGEINYLKAEQIYELSVLLESHKFFRNVKNLDEKLIKLIKRKIVRYERNLYSLCDNNSDNKFFILYELQVTKNPSLSLIDIMILETIKSFMVSFPDIHLLIFISDLEFLNDENNSKDYNASLIANFSKEKLSNILLYLNFDSEIEKRIHAISSTLLKVKSDLFQKQKDEFKKLINKKRTLKLFNLKPIKENIDLALDYPCYLSIAPNPMVYNEYIHEITSDFRCLIINSIYNMNRYELSFPASKVLSFKEPVIISLQIIPPLNEDLMILYSDNDESIVNKINKIANKENINWEIFCQYLSFLEENNEKYNQILKNYEENKENDNKYVVELIKNKFKNYEKKDIKDINLNKILIKIE